MGCLQRVCARGAACLVRRPLCTSSSRRVLDSGNLIDRGGVTGRNFMILGPPGAGKGTYSKHIAKMMGGVPVIGTGDMVRTAIASGSELGRRLQLYNDLGKLVPDNIVNELLRERLESRDKQPFLRMVQTMD